MVCKSPFLPATIFSACYSKLVVIYSPLLTRHFQLDAFTVTTPVPRRPKCENLYDVFVNIRDDEVEHESTMQSCQVRGHRRGLAQQFGCQGRKQRWRMGALINAVWPCPSSMRDCVPLTQIAMPLDDACFVSPRCILPICHRRTSYLSFFRPSRSIAPPAASRQRRQSIALPSAHPRILNRKPCNRG